jgi:hypothetical protein
MRFQLRSLNNNFRTPTLILVVLLGAPGVRAAAQSIPTILLPAAIVDRPYNYQITVTQPNGRPVSFAKIDGDNAGWLQVSSSGLLEGTPDVTAPAQSTIRVGAKLEGRPQVAALLVVPVEKAICPRAAAGNLAWCELSQNSPTEEGQAEDKDRLMSAVIDERIQFSRIRKERGMFYILKNINNWDEDPTAVVPNLARELGLAPELATHSL